MDVKEAIAKAKAYVQDVYSGEDMADLELEETEYSPREGTWRIAVSFSRPKVPLAAAQPSGSSAIDMWVSGGRKRVHKVVFLASDGMVTAMKDRAWMTREG